MYRLARVGMKISIIIQRLSNLTAGENEWGSIYCKSYFPEQRINWINPNM